MDNDNPAPRKPTEQQEWVGAVCAVCGWEAALMGGRAGKLVKGLRAAHGQVAEVIDHYGQEDHGAAWWWYRDDWRGKRGQRPSDGAIRETWGAWRLPIAVAGGNGMAGVLAFVEELRRAEQEAIHGT